MQYDSIIWGFVTIIAVLVILSVSIIAGVIIHSRKIKEEETKFRMLFNNVSDALIIFDHVERIIGVNDSSTKLLGYERRQFSKIRLKDVIVKDKWLNLHEEFGEIIKKGKEYHGESKLVDKKGRVIDVEVIGVNIKLNGSNYIMTSFRDITQRKHNETQLRKKHIALQEVLTFLEEEKVKIKQQVAKTVDQVLMPALNRLTNGSKTINGTYYDVLKHGLEELSSSSSGILQMYSKLTPREIEICNLIKSGATSKEIANALNISMLTVNKHRERIRKKLAISNKDINLTSYLNKL
jgi:PAS domain S-box-containing protein